jgi:Domain of unknown function (DUF4124)
MNPTWHRRRLSRLTLAALSLAAATPVLAETVQRCESADGKVTYSNTQCPAGTSATRKVNTSPPVAVDEEKAAKDRARRDAAEVKEIEKARAKEEQKAERTAAEQKKAQDKQREKCDRAKHDVERAVNARAALQLKAATVEQMQKADREISKREAEATKACTG